MGAREHVFDSGLYCETCIRTDRMLLVPDALADGGWKDNPDVKLDMIWYMGMSSLYAGARSSSKPPNARNLSAAIMRQTPERMIGRR